MKSFAILCSSFAFFALCGPLFTGCERKPTVAEIEAARKAAEVTPAPTPKPGEWMYDKKRKTTLDATPRRY